MPIWIGNAERMKQAFSEEWRHFAAIDCGNALASANHSAAMMATNQQIWAEVWFANRPWAMRSKIEEFLREREDS